MGEKINKLTLMSGKLFRCFIFDLKKKIQVGLVKKTAGWNYAHIKLIRQFIETANNQANLNDMNASFNGFQRDRQLPQ